jgi:starvation-inducible DNA-binding protein
LANLISSALIESTVPSATRSSGKSPSRSTLLSRNGQSGRGSASVPILKQRSPEIQPFGTLAKLPNGLEPRTCEKSVAALNQVLADTMTLRDLYKKHHWQVAGPTFYQLHLLFDKHYGEQAELVDMIAERIQLLGGISVAMAADVAEMTQIERPPRGRETVPVQISRLLEAHEIILESSHKAAKAAADSGDDGTNDLLVSNVIRTNELQVWFVAEHSVPESLVGDQ